MFHGPFPVLLKSTFPTFFSFFGGIRKTAFWDALRAAKNVVQFARGLLSLPALRPCRRENHGLQRFNDVKG